MVFPLRFSYGKTCTGRARLLNICSLDVRSGTKHISVHLVLCSYGVIIIGIGCGHRGTDWYLRMLGVVGTAPGIDAHYVPLKCAR